MKQHKKPVIALTGASGYIGSHLIEHLSQQGHVVALSRHGDDKQDTDHISWRSCDLFSLQDAEKGLKGADIAIYLVHSMKPGAKLTQASFEDMDLILADNFAKAAKRNGVKQIVYLSGLMPVNQSDLSRHLRSRLEVEKVLQYYGTPVTVLRAGLIIGPEGSSFPILATLVKRLPAMLLPTWTRTNTHPIALNDVLHAFVSVVDQERYYDQIIDLGGPEVMSYREMMFRTAAIMNKKRRLINVPVLTVKLSRLWVMLTTQYPKETVYPLIESLRHPMVADDSRMVAGVSDGRIGFEEAVQLALAEGSTTSRKTFSQMPLRPLVRSIQRVPLPEGASAKWAAQHYISWLAKACWPLLRTETRASETYVISLRWSSSPLLVLSFAKERSTTTRALFYITGGLFANVKESQRGRIEFRQVPGKQECLIAIHEYMPSLPWVFYKATQAKAHLLVMTLYKWHLMRFSAIKNQAFQSDGYLEA